MNKNGFDFVKLFIYLAFTLAILFYILSSVISPGWVMLILAGILLIIGIILTIFKCLIIFKENYLIYRSSLNDMRLQLIEGGCDFTSLGKTLKSYKKTVLKDYRFMCLKYFVIMLALVLAVAYIIYFILRIIFGG